MLLVVGVASAGLVVLVLWPPLLLRVTRLLTTKAGGGAGESAGGGVYKVPAPRAIGVGIVANVLAWVAYGIAFWLFARGTLPDTGLRLPQAIAASTAAYVVGILAPFAPGGLGVRESILVIALRSQTGLGAALALAAVARIGMTVAELGAATPFVLRGRSVPS